MLFEKLLKATHRPSLSRTKFENKRGYYVVYDGETYHYYQIKVSGKDVSPIYRFEKAPPLLRDGFATIPDRNNVTRIYAVTVDDMLRGVIRKSREISKQQLEVLHGATPANQHAVGPTPEEVVLSNGEPGAEASVEMENDAVIDEAWLGEIEALFSAITAKEE